MATRVWIRGRPYRVRGNGDAFFDEESRPQAPTDRFGHPVDTWPKQTSEKVIEFRAGVPYTCPEDQLTYRVLKVCAPADGWAPSVYWRRRWGVTFASLKLFCGKGWMQPAIEEGSPTKRFRCIDEAVIIDWLQNERGRRVHRFQTKWRNR